MVFLIRLLTIFLLLACACTKAPVAQSPQAVDPKAQQVYEQVRRDLDRAGTCMDYDTLFSIYKILAGTETPVPRMDELLFDLLEKRNEDPRLDQMIVILSADIIGRSKYPISRVSALFDTILQMDDNRINDWVLVYVADALGRYAIDLPDGDRLADLLEARVEQVHQSYDPSIENFGQHFLPPPKSKLIVYHITAIEDQIRRQKERNAYYLLILKQHTEEEIEEGLHYLQTHALPEMEEKCPMPLSCLFQHWDEVRTLVSASVD